METKDETKGSEIDMKGKGRLHVRLIMVLGAFLSQFLLPFYVYAAEIGIINTRVYEGDIYVYVRGITQIQDGISVQIGNTMCASDKVSAVTFQDMEISVKTLVLIDNSKSIPEKGQKDIHEIMEKLIAASRENEQIKIGTFSDKVSYLSDYTGDKDILNNVINGISYYDQDSFLGDVLYEEMNTLNEKETDSCIRILVISDGADDNSIGYTNDEIRSYIGENSYQVYTVGIPGKDNSQELEVLFSFSRAAKSNYFLMDGSIVAEDVVNTLQRDQEGVCLKITPDESLKDGSEKNILLQLNTPESSAQLTTSVYMPFGAGISINDPVPETEEASAVSAEQDKIPEEASKESVAMTEVPDLMMRTDAEPKSEATDIPLLPIITGIIVMVTAAVTVIIILISKKKRRWKARWASQLLEALRYLHGQPPYGILHGDIKPANIMLRPNGDICLIDFNIALALGEEGAVNVGYSRGYASPEHYSAGYISGGGVSVSSLPSALSGERLPREKQKRLDDASDETVKSEKSADLDETQKRKGGEGPDRRQRQNESGNIAGRSIKPSALSDGKSTRKREGILLDVRSDIYSLGATLYHLLSGIRPAQDAKDVKALTADVCSPAVSAILQKAMEPDPINRYQTAEEMLEAFLSLHKTDSRVVLHRRRMMRTAVLSVLVLLLGGGSTFVGLKQLEQRQTALALAEYSANALAQGDVVVAVSQALAAIPRGTSILDAPVTAQARKALTDVLGVYDLSDGFKPVGTITLPGAPFDLSVSPEGSRLAVVYGYEAAVFNMENLEKIAALPIQESALADCLFIDVDHVIYAGEDGVACYDLAAQQVVWTGEVATTLAVSYDGSTVAAVNRDAGYATIYNAVDGSVKTECTFDGQNMAVAVNDIFADPKNAIFSLNRDGSLLAVSFYNGGLTIFDLQDHDNSMIMYDTSEYNHFNGGFCGKYFHLCS